MNAAYSWNDAASALFAWAASGSDDLADLSPAAVAFFDDALACYIERRWSRYPAKDDLRQTAWLRLLRSLRLIPDYSRRNFRAWFLTQARWACGDAYRSLRSPEVESLPIDREPTASRDELASRVAFRELVEGLSLQEQVMLELRFFAGWNLREIGDAYEITTAGAGNIVYAAIGRLQSGKRLRGGWRDPAKRRGPKTNRRRRAKAASA